MKRNITLLLLGVLGLAVISFSGEFWLLSVILLLCFLSLLNLIWLRKDWLARAVDKKTAELTGREHRYRSLVEQASDGIFVLDVDSHIREVNGSALRLFGYREEELVGHKAYLLAPASEWQRRGLKLHSLEVGRTVSTRRWMRRRDGSVLPVEVKAKMLPDSRLLVFVRDITAQVQSEQTLQRRGRALRAVSFSAEQFLRSSSWREHIQDVLRELGQAIDASRVYIFEKETDEDGAVYITQHYEWVADGITAHIDDPELQRMPVEEAGITRWTETLRRGKVMHGLVRTFPPAIRPLLREQKIQSLVLIPVFVGESWWGFLGFDECLYEREWTPAEIEAMQIAADTLGAAIQREQNEQQVRTAAARAKAQAVANSKLYTMTNHLLERTQQQWRQMQHIVATVPEGVIVIDANYRILLANPAAQEYLSLLTDVTVGHVLQQLDDRPLPQILEATGSEMPWYELTPEGTDRIFTLTERPMEGTEGTSGWVLVIRDVTEERRQQLHVQNQERLATVGQLAAGIAHDFNNIMAIIMLYSQALERNPDFPKRQEYLATISKQAGHAADLISQILDFSRRAVMERGRLDLLPFVKEVVKLLQRTLPESIVVGLEAEDGGYLVNADPTRLQQALMNLALNARDAMPDGGKLTIELSKFKLEPGERSPVPDMDAGHWMRLEVRDTGTGIDEENVPHLFEPFFTTKQPGRGTGLGLAQVYGIVKQHGGEIVVTSVEGEGTTFDIYLPALETKERAESTALNGQLPYSDHETILLVEDHEPTQEAIHDTLEMMGYDVLVASTGCEALELFREYQENVDLVLSDMVMPEMGGVDLYQRLTEQRGQIKMMVMTGYPLEDEGRSLLEQGIVDWIHKPFAPDVLATKLRQVLDRT